MSYNTKKTMFDNYLLEVAAKIGDPRSFDVDDAADADLDLHERIEFAVDSYLKHAKHNQKAHGQRGSAASGDAIDKSKKTPKPVSITSNKSPEYGYLVGDNDNNNKPLGVAIDKDGKVVYRDVSGNTVSATEWESGMAGMMLSALDNKVKARPAEWSLSDLDRLNVSKSGRYDPEVMYKARVSNINNKLRAGNFTKEEASKRIKDAEDKKKKHEAMLKDLPDLNKLQVDFKALRQKAKQDKERFGERSPETKKEYARLYAIATRAERMMRLAADTLYPVNTNIPY